MTTISEVLNETARVRVELYDPPRYTVDLTGGATLRFTARQIASMNPAPLNRQWLAAHPRCFLGATREDFETIVDRWLSIAQEEEPKGWRSPWEQIADRVGRAVARAAPCDSPVGLLASGIYQEPNGPLWVSELTIIAPVARAAKVDIMNPKLIEYLRRTGALYGTPSKVFVTRGIRVRAWAFDPETGIGGA